MELSVLRALRGAIREHNRSEYGIRMRLAERDRLIDEEIDKAAYRQRSAVGFRDEQDDSDE